MMAIKSLLLLLLFLGIAAGLGIAGCACFGFSAHMHDILPAFSVALAAASLALVPVIVQKGQLDTAQTFMAALIGTVLHMAVILLTAIGMLLAKRATLPFAMWLLASYWATLIGLCIVFAKLIQSAPKPAVKEK